MRCRDLSAQAQYRTPWLGNQRGALVDWVTQKWVQLSGVRTSTEKHPWLDGPSGSTHGIGSDFFEEFSKGANLVAELERHASGLIETLELLDGPSFQAASVEPAVRDFYEQTSEFELEIWSEWCGLYKPFGRLVAFLFSRRLQQLNVPLSTMEVAHGVTSKLVKVRKPTEQVPIYTGWVRSSKRRHTTVYVGAYSVVRFEDEGQPCVSVVFPLPNGRAIVILEPVGDNGALILSSKGRRFGDPGFYFVVDNADRSCSAKYVRTFHEDIRVYTDPQGQLRTDHRMRLWGGQFMHLHYRLRRKPA